MQKQHKKLLLIGASALALMAAAPATANTIGSVAAVNQDMEGTPPNAARRNLPLGEGVFLDERIETSPIGSGQLMFLDQTTLTVAPGSTYGYLHGILLDFAQ